MTDPTAATSASSAPSLRLAVLGAGRMGGAIVEGVLAGGTPASHIAIAERAEVLREQWAARGIRTYPSAAEAVPGAQVVLLAVKPHVVADVLTEVAAHLPAGAVVVSVAAGVGLPALESLVPQGTPVVRVMPNTPAMVGEGMSALSPGSATTDAQVEMVRTLLAPTGRTLVVAEKDMDAVTAVSGSGPAYVYHLAEAMIDAGVTLGLTREAATELTCQTVRGAAAMLTESGTHPTLLREQVVSPGGTTAAALAQFSRGGFHATVLDGMEACYDRSRELGNH